MAYLITKRSTTDPQQQSEVIASMRTPELVADLLQRLEPTLAREDAERLTQDLRTEDEAEYGGAIFKASEQ